MYRVTYLHLVPIGYLQPLPQERLCYIWMTQNRNVGMQDSLWPLEAEGNEGCVLGLNRTDKMGMPGKRGCGGGWKKDNAGCVKVVMVEGAHQSSWVQRAVYKMGCSMLCSMEESSSCQSVCRTGNESLGGEKHPKIASVISPERWTSKEFLTCHVELVYVLLTG